MAEISPTSLTLLMRVRNGDEVAWQRLVHIYGPIVYHQCRRRGFADEDAQDVTQDIFLAVSQSLENFRRDRPGDSFLRWLRSIASRRIVDWIRRNAENPNAVGGSTANLRVERIPERVDDDWNPDELKRQAFLRAVELMKMDFKESTWQAFWLSVVEGKTTSDVCSELGLKPAAVRKARSRVRQRLINELGDLLDLHDQ